jgi:hypothetical protein
MSPYWPKVDIRFCVVHVRLWHLADIQLTPVNVRFSNRPVGVKRFQTVHGSGFEVTRGLVLLYGIGTKALPSWDPKTRWNNVLGGLAVGRSKRTCEPTSSIVPRGTPFHRVVELDFPSIAIGLKWLSCRCCFSGPAELGAVNPNAMQDHRQPRASATMTLFMPRCRAIFIAQALSQDHLVECTSML